MLKESTTWNKSTLLVLKLVKASSISSICYNMIKVLDSIGSTINSRISHPAVSFNQIIKRQKTINY